LKKPALITGLAGLLVLSAASAASAQATATGTLTLALTATVLSPAIPTSTTIRCTLAAAVTGTNSSFVLVDNILDTAAAIATRSGSTAKCAMTLPYHWTLSGTSDTIILTYTIDALSSTTAAGRTISVYFATIAVPTNGSTTKFTLTGFI
jgi:hypothetical protein